MIAKPASEMKAVLPENSLNASLSPGKGECVLKSTGGDLPYNHWLDLINERNRPVELSEVSHARVNKVFPIVYCTNTKNIDDEDDWVPCILSKIQKDQYQVLDTNKDLKLEKDVLHWGGDDGLCNLWQMYYKYPSTAFVDTFCMGLEIAVEDRIAQEVSPRRTPMNNCTLLALQDAWTSFHNNSNKPMQMVSQPGIFLLQKKSNTDQKLNLSHLLPTAKIYLGKRQSLMICCQSIPQLAHSIHMTLE